MRGLHRIPLRGVAVLRGPAAWLAIASLLVLCLGPPLHSGTSVRDSGGATAIASLHDASLPKGSAHLAGLCSLCRAIAQTRAGLRSPAFGTVAAVEATGLPLPLAARAPAPRAPWLAALGSRAPPTPVLHPDA